MTCGAEHRPLTRGSRLTHARIEDASVKVEDEAAVKRLARYILRPPVSLERVARDEGSDEVVCTRKARKGQPGGDVRINAEDFPARVIASIPEHRQHTVFYYGWLNDELNE